MRPAQPSRTTSPTASGRGQLRAEFSGVLSDALIDAEPNATAEALVHRSPMRSDRRQPRLVRGRLLSARSKAEAAGWVVVGPDAA